jgi:hypothetical protein
MRELNHPFQEQCVKRFLESLLLICLTVQTARQFNAFAGFFKTVAN